jgi:hypothetical protein
MWQEGRSPMPPAGLENLASCPLHGEFENLQGFSRTSRW